MSKCTSNCNSIGIQIIFADSEHDLGGSTPSISSELLYTTPAGYIDISMYARWLLKVMERPQTSCILKVYEPKKEVCDVCFKKKVDETSNQT